MCPEIIKNTPLVNYKISDEKKLKISNVLKRPKMRFSAPQAPIFWGGGRGLEVIKNCSDYVHSRGCHELGDCYPLGPSPLRGGGDLNQKFPVRGGGGGLKSEFLTFENPQKGDLSQWAT